MVLHTILKHAITQNPWLPQTCTSLLGWIETLKTYADKDAQARHLVRGHLQNSIVQSGPFEIMAVHVLQHFQKLPTAGNDSLMPTLYQLQLFIFAVTFYDQWANQTIIVQVSGASE